MNSINILSGSGSVDTPPMKPDDNVYSTLSYMRISRVLFWTGFIMLFLAGFVLRFQHLDMPPIDFPADRQKSNTLIIEKMIGGEGFLDFRGEWLELRMLPWLVANNSVMCEWFNCEIWTLARIFSLFFGLLTVCLLYTSPSPRDRG